MHNQIWCFCLSMILAATVAGPGVAQDTEEPEAQLSPEGKPVTAEMAKKLDAALSKIQSHEADIKKVDARIESSKGMFRRVLEERTDRNRLALLKDALGFATELTDLHDEGFDISSYQGEAKRQLTEFGDAIHRTIRRSLKESRDIPIVSDITAIEQSAIDAQLAKQSTRLDEMFGLLAEGIDVAKRYGMDPKASESRLNDGIKESAEMRSIFLEVSIADLEMLEARLEQLPNDAELKTKVSVMANRVELAANSLKSMVEMLQEREMETTEYESQVIETTGSVTKDIMDQRVFGILMDRWSKNLTAWFEDNGLSMIFQGFVFILVLLLFWLLSKITKRVVGRALASSKIQLSELLKRTVVSWAKNLVLLVGLLIALSLVGFSVGPVLAGLGVAGFILGFALQDTLSNFASGIMILIYRPFDVGDILDAGGVFGTVNHMSLVNTTILTYNNQTLVVPNNKIWGDIITNITAQDIRRIDLTFGISYADDIPKTEKVLKEIVDSCDLVLKDPETNIRLHELGDSSVNFIVRPWARTENYWDVYWDITRKVKITFDENQISIPFPQRDVHLFREDKTAD